VSRPAQNAALAFLKQHPEIQLVDLLIPDMNGVLRGKRVQASKLPKLAESGCYLPASVFGMGVTGETMEPTGLGLSTGDGDLPCQIVPDSLAPVPWESGLAQVLLTMHEEDGAPFFGDPRTVLENVLARFREVGWTPVIAVELEFYLLDPRPTRQGKPQVPKMPRTGQRETEGQLYSLRALDGFSAFLEEVSQATQTQGIPADTAVAELDAGQFEINLQHVPDARQSGDHGVLLKRVIRGVAQKHRLEATFMPKPFLDQAGNGLHLHLSLLDDTEANLFRPKPGEGWNPGQIPPERLRHAVGGMLEILSESMLICAPHANSYHRFQPGSYAPCNRTWGYNNRTATIRIPAGPPDATRLEHRLAGAGSNPYLNIATLLAGIHHGLTNKIEPPAPIEGDAYQVPSDLSRSWEQASSAFEQAKVLPGYLGNEFCQLYASLKRGEQESFQRHLHPLEYDWYLRTL